MRKMLEDVPLARYEDPGNFLGFLKGVMKNRRQLHTWMDDVSRGLPVCKLLGMPFEPGQTWLIVRDPACIKHFLKDSFDLYSKPDPRDNPFFYYLQVWLGDGILTFQHGLGAKDHGEAWHRQRKIAANIFTRSNFQSKFQETFVAKGHRLCNLLLEVAKGGQRVDLQRLFFGYTMDSAMDLLCGEKTDTMGGEACAYGDNFDQAHRMLVEYVRPSQARLKQLEYLPFPFGGSGGLAWQLRSALNPTYRRFLAARRVIHAESDRIVAACRSDPSLGRRKDLLALFVQSEEKEQFLSTYLRDMVMMFMLAGRDTTACLLSWTFYMLATNPEVQAKLSAEIDQKLPGLAEPSLKSVSASAMPYLNGVVWEALRLHPPVPSDSKVCMTDDIMPNGARVPAGTVCIFLPYAMGRDPAVYPEPLAVKPERWIPFTAPSPYEFPNFQAGPRICLGQDMAIFEAKVCIVMLLQRFGFAMPPGEAEKVHYSNTLTMSVCDSREQDSHHLWMEPRPRA